MHRSRWALPPRGARMVICVMILGGALVGAPSVAKAQQIQVATEFPECVRARQETAAGRTDAARRDEFQCNRRRAFEAQQARAAAAPAGAPAQSGVLARRAPGVQPWEAELPDVDHVVQTIQGANPADAAARRATAFQVLEEYIEVRTNRPPLDLDSNVSVPGHLEFANYVRAKRDAEAHRKQLTGAVTDWPMDAARHEVLATFLSKPSQDFFWRTLHANDAKQAAAEQQAAQEDAAAKAHAAAQAVVLQAVAQDKKLAGSKNVDMTVFGVPLGEPLRLPACTGDDTSANMGAALTGIGTGLAETCVGDAAGSMAVGIFSLVTAMAGTRSAPAGVDTVMARLAQSKCPDWVRLGGSCFLSLSVKEGVVVGASVQTAGLSLQDSIEAKLQEKYRVPVSKPTVSTCTNKYGAVTKGSDRVWTPAGLYVSYEPLANDCIHGIVHVQIAGFHREQNDAVKAQDAAQPKM